MNIKIRPAVAADAKRWEEIHAAGWEYAYRGIFDDEYLDGAKKKFIDNIPKTAEWLAGLDAKIAMPLVAVNESDQIVGTLFGHIKTADDGTKTFVLQGLYNDPKFIGGGVGKKLMLGFAEWAAARGGKKFIVGCLEKNKSRGFYEYMGGVAVKSAPFRDQVEIFFEYDIPTLLKRGELDLTR